MNWRDRIRIDPQVCHGKARISDTRVMVSVVLDSLAANVAPEDSLRRYPARCPEDIQAAIAFAAELSRERVVLLASGP